MKAEQLTEMLDQLVADWSRERPDLEIDHKQIVYEIFILRSLLARNADEILARWSLNFTSYGVLATLRRVGSPHRLTPSELGRVLGLTSGGISNILRKLETLGYISRVKSGADRRGVLVELTERGLEVADDAATLVTESESRHLQGLSKNEKADLDRLLRRVIHSFA